jgi:uncharacterized membrane protein
MMIGWTMGPEAWLWLGVWVLTLTVMVWLLSREPRHSGPDDALEILRARLARGEITADDFETARRLLQPDVAEVMGR